MRSEQSSRQQISTMRHFRVTSSDETETIPGENQDLYTRQEH